MADYSEQVVPLVEQGGSEQDVLKRTELKGPTVLALFPFFVDDVLKLKDAEKKCGRAHCIGPVMQLAIWSPLIHASVMFSFMGLGVLHMWQETTSRTTLDTEITYPTYWWFLAFFGCLALMYLEVHIAKYSSISYSDKARKQFEKKYPDRPPISWPCAPVTVIDKLPCQLQEQWYFNAWFCWHFVLGMVTLYGRIQANTFIGMLLYGFLADVLPDAVNKIWDDTMTHSFMARGQSVPLTAILLFMFIAQILHYVFGALNYCPRRNWKTADHLRWQSDEWQAWGRSFELEVKGMRKQEKRITQMSEWEKWRDEFDGAQANASGANGREFHLTVPRGGTVYRTQDQDKAEYKPSDEDLPLTIKWVSNRHAYTNVLGEELTSSTAMDVIAECCSMGIMTHMQALELDEYKKAEGILSKYKGETVPTVDLAGELISEVRALMNDAVNVTRCAFSRVFLYGVCFVGIHLHFQVSYTNVVCASKQEAGASEQCARAESLWFGILAAFMSMLLVLEKIFKITRYQIQVWAVFNEYTRSLSQAHKELKKFKIMQGQISTARRSLLLFSILFFPSSFMFVSNFVWLAAKWYMETTVCPTVGSRMWNIPAWSNMLDPKSGCVKL